jgi:hypothetical protein
MKVSSEVARRLIATSGAREFLLNRIGHPARDKLLLFLVGGIGPTSGQNLTLGTSSAAPRKSTSSTTCSHVCSQELVSGDAATVMAGREGRLHRHDLVAGESVEPLEHAVVERAAAEFGGASEPHRMRIGASERDAQVDEFFSLAPEQPRQRRRPDIRSAGGCGSCRRPSAGRARSSPVRRR